MANVWLRMEDSVLRVRRRLEQANQALGAAGIAFAVVGGNAVAAWVATVDEGAVRNTRDVDLMVRREDFERVRAVLENAGFVYRRVAGVDLFLDHGSASARDAVHIIFSGEMVRKHEPAPNPDLSDAVMMNGTPVLALPALVQIKLTAWRDKDRTHLRDMLEVGLIDEGWVARLPAILGERLQSLIENPNG